MATVPMTTATAAAGGSGGDVNIIEVGGVAVSAGRLAVEPFAGAVFPVSDNGGSLTVDGTVAVSSVAGTVTVADGGGSLTVDGTVDVGNFPASQTVDGTVTVVDGGGSITVDGTVAVSGSVVIDDSTPIDVAVTNSVTVVDGGGSLTVDGTVAVSNFPAVQPVSDNGGSLTVDGTVAISGTVPVSFAVPVSVDDNGGSLTVDGTVAVSSVAGTVTVGGTVAVSNFPAVQPVSDNGGSLTIDDGGGSITVDGTFALASEVVEDTVVVAAPTMIPPAVEIQSDITATTVPPNGDWSHLYADANGSLWIRGEVEQAEPEDLHVTAQIQIGKADIDASNPMFTQSIAIVVEDNAVAAAPSLMPIGVEVQSDITATTVPPNGDWTHAYADVNGSVWVHVSEVEGTVEITGDVSSIIAPVLIADTVDIDSAIAGTSPTFLAGVMRDDALSTLTVIEGDATVPRVDSEGALWVRAKGDTVTLEKLSGSTDGQPVQITGTATGSANTVHTADASANDQLWLFVSNTSADKASITIELGGTGTGNEVHQSVEAGENLAVVTGSLVTNSVVVKAYASDASVLNVHGYVRRAS